MQPDFRRTLSVVDPTEDDATGWLLTFSDLCLQLFAFVLVALVMTTAQQRRAQAAAGADAATQHAAAREPARTTGSATYEHRDPTRNAKPADEYDEVAEDEAAEPTDDGTAERVDEATAQRPDDARAPVPLAAANKRLAAALAFTDTTGVSVATTAGEVVISLSDTIAFASGKADLLQTATPVLDKLRHMLQALPEYDIDVIGHTDDVPIHTAAFPSNLELSLARAARVASALAASDPDLRVRTRAAGFGEFRPVAANDDEAGRRQNRRVEIRLHPHPADAAG